MATWSSSRQLCGVYGGEFDLSSLPSNTWQIACVLYGGGCVLLGFSGLAALVCLLLPPHGAKRLACYTGYLQTMAGNTQLYCLIIYRRLYILPAVLCRCWLGGRKGIRPVKN